MAPAIRQAIEALQKSELPRGLATVTRKERAGLSDYYASRSDAPLWLDAEGHWTAAARGALARLQHADEDALDLKIPALPVLDDKGDDASRAATDVALSMAVVVYGKEASDGRVDPHVISSQIDDKTENFTPAQILTRVSEASDADAALRGFNPPQAGYAALREKLAELRHGKMEEVTPIPPGRLLRIGMHDDRVPLLRARFGLPAKSGAAARLYDRQVSEAVRAFQKEHRLAATGHLNGRTVEALSGGRKGRLEDDIIANMELWRWMPRDYGADRVEVNIPDFALKVVENGEVVHRAKVIVGKKNTPTPIFSNAIKFIVVNPYWNVPQSIIKKEMLPRLAQDPNYFRDMGYEAFYRHGRLVVRQPPGERNALGRIKFLFPNDHAVYLHDTPSKGLFSARVRAFSHGCVRVQEPFALAETVLGREKGWGESHFKKMVGGPQRTLRLPKALPIHIEYFTAYVDEKGHLQLRADVYGYSQKVKAALGLAG